jgi:hypothetical protein
MSKAPTRTTCFVPHKLQSATVAAPSSPSRRTPLATDRSVRPSGRLEEVCEANPDEQIAQVTHDSRQHSVDAIESYGNRRHRVEKLVSAWKQGIQADAESDAGTK